MTRAAGVGRFSIRLHDWALLSVVFCALAVVGIGLAGGWWTYYQRHEAEQNFVAQLRCSEANVTVESVWLGPRWLRSVLESSSTFESVVGIEVRDGELTEEHLAGLAALKNLESFDISGGNITCSALQEICRVRSLVYLTLSECTMSGDARLDLSGLANLQRLGLFYTNISPQRLERIAGLSTLPALHLAEEEELKEEAVDALCKMKHLSELDLQAAAMSLAASRRLREELPGTLILLDSDQYPSAENGP